MIFYKKKMKKLIKKKNNNNNNITINYFNMNINVFPFYFSLIFILILSNVYGLNSFSQITILINGGGEQTILGESGCYLSVSFNHIPSRILVNGILQNYTGKTVKNLDNKINNITMIWDYQLTNCNNMFMELNNIISIDLSKFDSSKVTSMGCMFFGCTSLHSLDLSNLDASLVTSMIGMFSTSSSLEYINLTNFNTSSATSMFAMFFDCHLLKSLDLSSFDTSKVTEMLNMFYNDYSLEKLNLFNFETRQVSIYTNMFYNVNNNLIYCINETKCSNIITNLLKNFKNNICSNKCFPKFQNLCLENCIRDINKYPFNNICSSPCPMGTHESYIHNSVCEEDLICQNYYNYDHSECIDYIPEGFYLNDSTYKTIDKCNIKCKNCSLESSINDLCISCNIKENYFPIFNNSNLETFIDCFNKIPEGFFFDNENNTYKPCYLSCKKCIKYGDEINNNCIECKDNYTFISFENDTNCYEKCKYYYYIDLDNKYYCTLNKSCPNNYTKLINEKNKCINNCIIDKKYIFEYNNICYESCPENTSVSLKNENICEENEFYENEYNSIIEDAKSISEIIFTSDESDKNNIEESTSINLENSTENNDCILNINYINDNLTINIITKYIFDYINESSHNINNLKVNQYININLNFTITIFHTWHCTNLLLEYDYFEINSNLIFDKINSNLKNKNNYVFIYINMNNKNYIEIYDLYTKIKINIKLICPDCFEGNNLKLKNNFTNEISSVLGKVITYKITENKIDPFNENNSIFNNICKNFTIEEIDIPIKERREIIFLGYKEKEIICNDIDCNIEKYYLSNFTGDCICKISNNFNYLISNDYNETNKMTFDEYKIFINSKSTINSFLIFKCGKEAFKLNNIKKNIGFYISITFILIQLILYGFNIYFYLNPKYNIKSNPPPRIQKFEIKDDLEENEDYNEKKSSKNKKDSDKEINKNTYLNKENQNTYNNEEKINFSKNIISPINTKIDDNLNKEKKSNIYEIDVNKNMEISNLRENPILNDIIFYQKETQENNNEKLISIKHKRSIKNLPPIQKTINSSKEDFGEKKAEKSSQEKNIIPFTKTSKSFMEYYWEFLSLEQPIINLLEPIQYLKIEKSYIPIIVKLMMIVLILSLNIFFNLFHLEQKYFRKKYKYFNDKYNIRYNI